MNVQSNLPVFFFIILRLVSFTRAQGCTKFGNSCDISGAICSCCPVGGWSAYANNVTKCVCRAYNTTCSYHDDCCSKNCVGATVNSPLNISTGHRYIIAVSGESHYCSVQQNEDLCDRASAAGCPAGSVCSDSDNADVINTNQHSSITYGECRAVTTTETTSTAGATATTTQTDVAKTTSDSTLTTSNVIPRLTTTVTEQTGCIQFGNDCVSHSLCCSVGSWTGYVASGPLKCVCRVFNSSCIYDDQCCSMKCLGAIAKSTAHVARNDRLTEKLSIAGVCTVQQVGDVCDKASLGGCSPGSTCSDTTNAYVAIVNQQSIIAYGECRVATMTKTTTTVETTTTSETTSTTSTTAVIETTDVTTPQVITSVAIVTETNTETTQSSTDSADCVQFGESCVNKTACQCCSVGRWSSNVKKSEMCACRSVNNMCGDNSHCCSMKCNQTTYICDVAMDGDLCDKNAQSPCLSGSECINTTLAEVESANKLVFPNSVGFSYGECRAVATTVTATNLATKEITAETSETSPAVSSTLIDETTSATAQNTVASAATSTTFEVSSLSHTTSSTSDPNSVSLTHELTSIQTPSKSNPSTSSSTTRDISSTTELTSKTKITTNLVTLATVLSTFLTSTTATTSTRSASKNETFSSTTSTPSNTTQDPNKIVVMFSLAAYVNSSIIYFVGDTHSPMPLSISELDKLIKDTNYSSTVFPGSKDGKLDIGVSLYVENFRPIDDLRMEWEVFTLITWMDERLNNTNGTEFGYVQLNSAKDRAKVWTPSIYFPQSRVEVPNILQDNKIIFVHSDGMVVFISRVILTAPCGTNLRMYPRNELDCSVYFSNLAQVGEHLDLIWMEPIMVKPLVAERLAPVTFSDQINPTLMTYKSVSLGASQTLNGDIGDCSSTRPCLSATVHCTKAVGYFVTDTIFPSFFTILVSWSSLFIRMDVVSSRVVVATSGLFALQGITAGFNGQLFDSAILSSTQIWLFGLQFQIISILIDLARRVHPSDEETDDFEAKEAEVELPESSDPIDIYFGITFAVVHILWLFLLY